ncbi:unnamed protein product [Fraxinus pennsylvanica]|uniref:Uncharacterized protein n=1 Tax=Fraxinus pennsylvanica TaxID=56036 RepID=A0AAD2A421_9LAMI|nr:unnamed protein product [Fraxinus pennsylvanica]
MAGGSRFPDGTNPPMLPPPSSPLLAQLVQVGIQLCIVFTVLVFEFFWLHSSCPSCHRNVVITRCQKCSGGGLPVARSSFSTESEPSDRREIKLSIHVLQSSLDE